MFPLTELLDVKLLARDKKRCRTANIFGLIAYSDRNPFVVKVLRDDAYWRSLNNRSNGWILYAVKPGDDVKGGNIDHVYSSLGVTEKTMPQLIILSIASDNTMLQRNYAIDGDSEESVYLSLERSVNAVTSAVKRILPEYKSCTTVHREAIKALDAELATRQWKKVTSSLKEFALYLFDHI